MVSDRYTQEVRRALGADLGKNIRDAMRIRYCVRFPDHII